MNPVASKSVVFITGAFVTHLCWEPWKQYFEIRGYKTYNPPWPFKDAPPEVLRQRQPNDVDLAKLTLKEVIDSYVNFVTALPEKPIVIGHSLGGLIVQILINRDYGAAGVAIHPVPPKGVFPFEFTFLRAGWKSLGIFSSLKKTYLMSFSDWQYAFVNGMPKDIQRKTYEENVIPESKTVARGGLTSAAAVDFAKPHVPLLITSGTEDTIIPAHLNFRNYTAYEKNSSVLDYKEFPRRNHFVLGQSTWKEDADYILNWLGKISS